MAIKGNVGLGITAIGAGTTKVVEPASGEREVVSAFALFNTTGGALTATVTFDGSEIAFYNLAAKGTTGDSAQVEEVIGQGLDDTQDISVTGSGVGINALATVTQYTAGD